MVDSNFPFEFKDLEPEETALIQKLYKSPYIEFVRLGPKGYITTRTYEKGAAAIYNMAVRPSDVYVITFQRSGTTWTQELVWLVANNFDFVQAKAKPLPHRYSFLEIFMFYNDRWQQDFIKRVEGREDKAEALAVMNVMSEPVVDSLTAAPSPRFIKTHMPLSLLSPNLVDTAKVVYVARDPRDVAVSSYHMSRMLTVFAYEGTFKEFWNMFKDGLVTQTPFFEHIKEAWELRHHPNMLFLFYEELSKDLPAAIQRVTDFMGKTITPEDMARMCDHLSIESFKKNKAVNFDDQKKYGFLTSDESFIRKGKVGGWRDYFDAELAQEAESWIADNLRDTDLQFPH